MASITWLQSFTRRKVLAYFLIQLFTLGILSAYPFSMFTLFSISVAMPFALEMSVKLSAFILKAFASLFTRSTRPVTPLSDTPEPELADEEQPEPASPSTQKRIATQRDFQAINQALSNGSRGLALHLFDDVRITNPIWLHTLCVSAIHCNAGGVFDRIIATPAIQSHLADHDNQLLRLICSRDRPTMLRALLYNQQVRLQAHTENNSILRVACSIGSLPIVEALLSVPNVVQQLNIESGHCLAAARRLPQRDIEQRLLAALRYHRPANHLPHDIPYQPIYTPAPNLRELANNRESAMASLNPQHQQQIGAIRTRYAQAFTDRGGVDPILTDIRAFLVENYRQNPVMHNRRALPLEYNAALPQEVQALYYTNKAHTAYRYLFLRPNPWVNPVAGYTRIHHEPVGFSAMISETEKQTIAYLWLAACDTTVHAPDGMTHADLKKLFAETILAGAGRGHNYDNAEINRRAGREVDDGQGDNPTCGEGASRWISQFLTLLITEPSSRPLNCNILRAKCRDILIAEGTNEHTVFAKLNRLDKRTLTATKTALENLISEHAGDMAGLNNAERNLLRALEPSQGAITAMLQECKDYFGEARITERDAGRIDFQGTRYPSFETVLQFIGSNLVQTFSNEIRTKIIELERPRSSRRKTARAR